VSGSADIAPMGLAMVAKHALQECNFRVISGHCRLCPPVKQVTNFAAFPNMGKNKGNKGRPMRFTADIVKDIADLLTTGADADKLKALKLTVYSRVLEKIQRKPQNFSSVVTKAMVKAAHLLDIEPGALRNLVSRAHTQVVNAPPPNDEVKQAAGADAALDESMTHYLFIKEVSTFMHTTRANHEVPTARTVLAHLESLNYARFPPRTSNESMIRWVRETMKELGFRHGERHRGHSDIHSVALAQDVIEYANAIAANEALPAGQRLRYVFQDESYIYQKTCFFNHGWYDPKDSTDEAIVQVNTGQR